VGPAFEAFGEVGVQMRSAQLVAGVRYLVMGLGRLSRGDEIVGSAGGLIGDVGYRLAW
jgi:hypothetical protein